LAANSAKVTGGCRLLRGRLCSGGHRCRWRRCVRGAGLGVLGREPGMIMAAIQSSRRVSVGDGRLAAAEMSCAASCMLRACEPVGA